MRKERVRTVYVIVHVTYDRYRFQDNLDAVTSIRAARRLAKKHASAYSSSVLPIIEHDKESFNMDHTEVDHIYIDRFPKIKPK